MAQGRQQRSAAWPHYAQPAAVQPTTVVNARVACEQLEQMSRKLAAARAEISRYQTRLFACERQMLALRKENAALEAACEQAREEAQRSAEEAEKLRAALRLDDDVPAVPQPQPVCRNRSRKRNLLRKLLHRSLYRKQRLSRKRRNSPPPRRRQLSSPLPSRNGSRRPSWNTFL